MGVMREKRASRGANRGLKLAARTLAAVLQHDESIVDQLTHARVGVGQPAADDPAHGVGREAFGFSFFARYEWILQN